MSSPRWKYRSFQFVRFSNKANDKFFNIGICVTKPNQSFECQCFNGYQGKHCHLIVNLCQNKTCYNHGFCLANAMNATCHCLSGFTGESCEFKESKYVVQQYFSSGTDDTINDDFIESRMIHFYHLGSAYMAILMICALYGFIIIMDVLKYVFHIDPVGGQRKKMRRNYFLCVNRTAKNRRKSKERILYW